jgi:hypothetical protein
MNLSTGSLMQKGTACNVLMASSTRSISCLAIAHFTARPIAGWQSRISDTFGQSGLPAGGPGGTKQAQALACRKELAANIAQDRAQSHNKTVLRALKDFDDDTLALNLMAAGISVAWADDLGVDRDGRKNLRNMACWIGSNLRCRGETGVKVGVWAIEMLRDLPPSLWTAKS